MDTCSTFYVKAAILPCKHFAADRCSDGYCGLEHHENLNARLVGSREPKGYMVPNKFGEACQNCLDNLRECDKKHRGPDDRDPCSECRHFGGTTCECTLSTECSYNKIVYDKILSRGHVYDYTLAAPGDRTGSPMPPHRIKKGWVGQTKEQLLAKPDFLPTGVRDCPRAFVVAPQEYLQRMRRESSPDGERSWQLPATFWDLPPSLPPPEFPRPPPMVSSDVVRYSTGGVEYSTFVWETSQWRHVYETGYTQPCSLPPPSFSRPQPDPTAGKIMHTTFIWRTSQWRHVYENNTLVTFPHYQIDLAYNGNRRSRHDFGSDDDDST